MFEYRNRSDGLAKGGNARELLTQRRAIGHGVTEPGVRAVTNDAARVHEQMAHGEVTTEGLLRPREVRDDRVVKAQLAALDELHDDRRGEGLRDGGAAKRRGVGVDGLAGLYIGEPVAAEQDVLALVGEAEGDARHASIDRREA